MIKQHDWNLKTQHQTTRLTKKKTELIIRKTQNYMCKRCFVKFDNNIKLYEHVRTKHAKKSKSLISITIALITSFFSFFFVFFICIIYITCYNIYNIKKFDIMS